MLVLFPTLLCLLSFAADPSPQVATAEDSAPATITKNPNPANRYERFDMQIDGSIFDQRFDRTKTSQKQIDRMIDDVHVTGVADTTARVDIRFVPNENAAEFEVAVNGTTVARTTGSHDPVCVCTRTTSHFTARKEILFDSHGMHASEPQTSANSHVQLIGVSSRLHGLFHRIAVKRATKSFYERRHHNQRRTEREIQASSIERLTDVVEQRRQSVNELISQPFLAPFRGEHVAGRLQFATTADELFVRGWVKDKPPEYTPMPKLGKDCLFDLRVQESLVDDLADVDLSDREFTSEQIRDFLDANFQGVFSGLDDANIPPWRLRFAKDDPLGVHFDDGEVVIVLAAEKLMIDGQERGPISVRATYTLDASKSGADALRRGKLQFAPVLKPKMMDYILPLSDTFTRPFESLFTTEIDLRQVIADGALRKLDGFSVSHVHIDKGWLSLGIDRDPVSPATPSDGHPLPAAPHPQD